MASYTDYADDTSGNNLYAKPEPLTTSPWSTGVVTGTENGSTGSYAFTLDSSLSYVVFRRAGASPASSDLKLGRFSKNLELEISNRVDVTIGTRLDETDALIETLDTVVDAIAEDTALIGTASALVASPVTPQGKITQIFIGDDYLAANGRSFQWTITEPTGFVAATSTCSFGGSNGTDSWLVSGTITDNGSTWTLKFDMTKTDTDIEAGNYDWTVEVKSASNVEHTVSFGGDTRLRRKYT